MANDTQIEFYDSGTEFDEVIRKYGINTQQRGFEITGVSQGARDLRIRDLETGEVSIILGPGRVSADKSR